MRNKVRHVESALAALLLIAGSLKMAAWIGSPIKVLPAPIHNPVLPALLIQSEFLLALWLLVGGFARVRFICAIVCFSLFALVAGYETLHAVASCGCFGNVKVPPAATAALDVSAVVALCWTRRASPPRPSRRRLISGLCAALLLSGGLWTNYFAKAAHANAIGDLQVLEPSQWINKPFSLFDEIDGSTPLRSGNWLLVFYHFDCEDCLKAISDEQSLAAAQSTYHVAFIAMPPFAPAGRDPVADSQDYLHLRLRPDHEWFATTPVLVQLQDGRVLAAAEGLSALHPANLP